MFANSIKIENDSSFLEYTQASVSSYRIYKNKVIINGELDISDDFLHNFKTIMRVSFSSSSLQKEEYLSPSEFLFTDLELVVDNIAVSQRVITSKKFMVEVPAQPNLSNFSVYASFITSTNETNFINYYSKDISTVWSSELIRTGILSDKTQIPILFDESYFLDEISLPKEEQLINTSELFYTLDNNNNFFATAFFNLKNLFVKKIRFPNLMNVPDFFDYFRQNYLIQADAILYNGSFRQSLNVNQEKNIYMRGETQSIALTMNYDNIDIEKFDGGLITVDFLFQEKSVEYIQDIIIPSLTKIEQSLVSGIQSNSVIDILLYYKILKEVNSTSLEELLFFKQANEQVLINDEDVWKLRQYISYIKNIFIKNISDVAAYNLFDTKVSIRLEQTIDLNNHNTHLNFFELVSNNPNFPTYRLINFTNSFSNEVSRFYGTANVTADNTELDFSSLNITFSPSNIFLSNQRVLQNKTDFSKYNTNEISEDELDLSSFEFAKICSFFDFGKNTGRVQSYDFHNLLDRDLFLNGVSVFEEKAPQKKNSSPSTFNTIKKDDSVSYNQFPTGMRDEVCTDSSVRPPVSNVTQQQTKREIPDNLFNNVVTNNSFVESNLYSNSYSNVSISNNLPIQIIYPTDQFRNRTNTLFKNAEPVVANGKLFSTFYINFKIIAKIEFLDVLTDGMFSMWKPLRIVDTNSLIGKKMLCKISFYKNSDCNVGETTFDAFSIYNRYFFLET